MSVFSFITQPWRYSVQADTAVRTAYELARQVEINSYLTDMDDADDVALELFNILKSPRQRFDVPVIGIDVVTLEMYDGLPPMAVLMNDRFMGEKSNVILNGTFASAANWNLGSGWSISGGVANSVASSAPLTQTDRLVPGLVYEFSFDYTMSSGSRLRINHGGSVSWISPPLGAAGTMTGSFTAQGTTFGLEADSAVFSGTIDNVVIVPKTQGKLVAIPDFTIDLSAGQTVLRCWG